jgi:xylulokinase
MAEAGGGFVLGYDFGTSTVKAALFRRDGSTVARASAAYPLSLPQPGWAEQNPDDWWDAIRSVTQELITHVEPAAIEAIGLCTQMCGVVLADEKGEALCPCPIWLDTRSAALARRIFGGTVNLAGYGILTVAKWLRITGGAPNLSGRDATTKILWLREERPDLWARTAKVLDIKDYLISRCTGRSVTSFDCAHLTWVFDARASRKEWSASLLKTLGLDKKLFPEITPATQSAGTLNEAAAAELGLKAGTPVSVGLGDVAAAAFGSGAVADGAPHLCIGTSAWLGTHVAKPMVSPFTGIGTITRADGEGYLLIAIQENAGASVKWAMEALGFGPEAYDAFEREAANATPRSDAPMFLPWLYGERVPIQDENIRGGFLNLSIGQSRGDLARAVYEGVALNMRWAMGTFDRMGNCAGKPLRLVGGGGNASLWAQIFSDILGRPVEAVEENDLAGARGAGITAALAAGWYKDVETASAMVKVSRSFKPDPALRAHYDARYARFVKSYKRLKPWYGSGGGKT